MTILCPKSSWMNIWFEHTIEQVLFEDYKIACIHWAKTMSVIYNGIVLKIFKFYSMERKGTIRGCIKRFQISIRCIARNLLDMFWRISNNMQLKTFSCWDWKVFEYILSSNINLSSFVFPLCRWGGVDTINAMKKCNNQIESYDLRIGRRYDMDIVNEPSQMEKIKGLQIPCYTFLKMVVFPHIQWLDTAVKATRESIFQLVRKFPNLTELWIKFHPVEKSDVWTNDYVTILIDGLPKLKHLYIFFMNGINKKKTKLNNCWNVPFVTVHVE